MEQKKPKKVYVIGHKNPDTDSICSAICICKSEKSDHRREIHSRSRAGEVNGETSLCSG